jgi:dCMP deaminase
VALMLHPGLVMPTSVESGMQIAYSVKQNSGCISRQVGAVVTDAGFSVKAVGWNNSAQGQVPCLLRSADDLIQGIDAPAFSSYERTDQRFRKALTNKFGCACNAPELHGRNLSFCFKDLQNEIDNEKNQVHTRSLHAEENAFLQISKLGGVALSGGILFTTASPCELCAKKAYQLGLSRIIYIDPYPGIATSHVLSSGERSPRLELFRGAVGRAFHRLYQPVMPYKDELELLLGLKRARNSDSERILDLENENAVLRAEILRLTSSPAAPADSQAQTTPS